MFTKRKVLSIISSFYDPMGLISAYLVILKIMMRETTALPDLGWDTPLPEEMQKDWTVAIRLLLEQEEVVLDRGTKPSNALVRPESMGYWDGSLLAYAALLYIRWLLDTDPPNWKSSLLNTRPVLFNCLNTGAVDIRLAYKQGTDAFLTAWNTFCDIRGDPATVYSDRGTNLTKAATYVEEEDPDNWGWDHISKSSAKKGTVRRFTPP